MSNKTPCKYCEPFHEAFMEGKDSDFVLVFDHFKKEWSITAFPDKIHLPDDAHCILHSPTIKFCPMCGRELT